MENFKEKIKNPEANEYSSKIELHFFRHGESEPAVEGNDSERKLTQRGRESAVAKSKGETNVKQSIAFGSPRERSQQTAGLVMAGREEVIEGNESLEELKDKLESMLKIGKKIAVEERLDYPEDPSTEYYRRAWEHVKNGDILKFMVEESDRLAKELNDDKNFTYSRLARQIAEIIKKYLTIFPRWNELASDKTKDYSNTLERFMGTHQTVPESFLAKVIEKTRGVEERNRFIELLGNKGFDYTEGFDLEISNTADGFKICILYKNEKDKEKPYIFDQEISAEILDEIINEGK